MNQVLQAAAAQVNLGWVLGVMTIVFFACFVGFSVWAFLPRNRARFEEDARMPLTDGGES